MGDAKTGSCVCGDVAYRVTGPLRPVIACHCTQCRKTSGHHVAATSAPRESVEIMGEVQWYGSSETARRGFCPVCGSNLFWDGCEPVDLCRDARSADGLTLEGHIFCADKGDYYEISDGLPTAEQRDRKMTTMKL